MTNNNNKPADPTASSATAVEENLEKNTAGPKNLKQTADYICDMALQLRLMALDANQTFLAHLLEMVVIEAMETARKSGDYHNRIKSQDYAN